MNLKSLWGRGVCWFGGSAWQILKDFENWRPCGRAVEGERYSDVEMEDLKLLHYMYGISEAGGLRVVKVVDVALHSEALSSKLGLEACFCPSLLNHH